MGVLDWASLGVWVLNAFSQIMSLLLGYTLFGIPIVLYVMVPFIYTLITMFIYGRR